MTTYTQRLNRLILAFEQSGAIRSNQNLDQDLTKILLYFREIEGLVEKFYYNMVCNLPLSQYQEIVEFAKQWSTEEERHKVILDLYLQSKNIYAPEITSPKLSLKTKLTLFLAKFLRPITLRVYLLIGMVNEATTASGYGAIKDLASDVDLKEIAEAIKIEESHHFGFYKTQALKLLKNSCIEKCLVKLFFKYSWQPVGSGEANAQNCIKLLLANKEICSKFYLGVKTKLKALDNQLPWFSEYVILKLKELHS